MPETLSRAAAMMWSALYLGLFLSGFISFIGTGVGAKPEVVSALIYAIYGFGLFFSAWVVVRDVELRTDFFKILLVCAFAAAPVLADTSGLDGVEKSHLVAMGSIFMFAVIIVAGGAEVTGRFAASVVVLASLFCLLDANFQDGFTNTPGRAAGLFVNPNVAALTLLIGATGSIWAVPSHWRLAFAILVGGAVFSTLSRSSMLLGLLTMVATIPFAGIRVIRRPVLEKCSLLSALIALTTVIALFMAAYANNRATAVAADNAIEGLRFAMSVWERARSDSMAYGPGQIALSNDAAGSKRSAPSDMQAENARGGIDSKISAGKVKTYSIVESHADGAGRSGTSAEVIKQGDTLNNDAAGSKKSASSRAQTENTRGDIDSKTSAGKVKTYSTIVSHTDDAGRSGTSAEVIKRVEQENSAAARGILLQRAFEEYRSGPMFGRGLKRAFELAPHNNYLLFAVAFGHLGWLIIPAFVWLILSVAGWRRGLPPAFLIAGASLFSHDVFISLPMVAAISVVLAGLIGRKHEEFRVAREQR